MSLPTFKYNPNPVALNVISKEKITCPVCKQECEYIYEGPFYLIDHVEGICRWCIFDGSAAKLYDGEFQDPGRCDEVENDELIHRTPGYFGWQQEYWLSLCSDFCAIV
ncbi:CbrC family protein [Bacillus velezensis]|uniref:CbrC family protein n=1 Tax=Bacillus velezensis TaxID=492670 RepID=UPI0035C221C9